MDCNVISIKKLCERFTFTEKFKSYVNLANNTAQTIPTDNAIFATQRRDIQMPHRLEARSTTARNVVWA